MKKAGFFTMLLLITAACFAAEAVTIEEVKGKTGAVVTDGGDLAIRVIEKKHGFGKNRDADIFSPKSATFSKDGKKIYVNSLEGCKTVVYDAETRKKLKVIEHSFDSGTGSLWLPPSGYYKFTHYPEGEKKAFKGKPVEAALSKDGKYLFVPYYRRTFDLNAQDPSALAVIDTDKDEIVLMTETGPLPKMVRVSNDGNLLAITHWGDNTVGLMDISDKNPGNWKMLAPVTVGKKLNLNYSLKTPVNRDSGSGYLLRGTVFLPGDSLLLVSGMAGPLAVIDVGKREWIGMVPGLSQVRHITMKDSLLYMSRNSAGEVLTVPVAGVANAVSAQRGHSREFKIDGIRRAKVGGGARTLKVSPSGKYIFVASNTASEIGIVRTEDMKLIGRIKADSYPVGLDISPDGQQLVSTSQGRKGVGGNAVNFFEIAYADPEAEAAAVIVNSGKESYLEDSVTIKEAEEPVENAEKDFTGWIIGMGIGVLILSGIIGFSRFKSASNKNC